MYTSPSPSTQQQNQSSQYSNGSAAPASSASSQQHGGSLTLVRRLRLLASDAENQPIVCRRGVLPSLLLFLQNTDPDIRIIAAETLALLSSHPDNPECLCRERGLVQVIVSTYRTSKDADPIMYDLCGTIIKNLGPAVNIGTGDNNNKNLKSPFHINNNNNKARSGSTFTQLEFLSGSRQRGHANRDPEQEEEQVEDEPEQQQQQMDDEQYYEDEEENNNNNVRKRTPSPEANTNSHDNNVTRSPLGGNNNNNNNNNSLMMTTTRRFNPRTRSSHFINGGMPPNSVCRNVQMKIHQLVPARRQHLVECLHTTRGVISYTIDLPTRQLTVFLSVPASNLVTTLAEDGFDHVDVQADVEVNMNNTYDSNSFNENENNNCGGNNLDNNNGGGYGAAAAATNRQAQNDDAMMVDNLNQFYLNSKRYKMNSNGHGQDEECENYQQLSEYKKSLMVSAGSSKSNNSEGGGSVYDKENNSLIARIQKRKEIEQKQGAWDNVWEVLKNVFW